MPQLSPLTDFLKLVETDPRIGLTHIGLFTVLHSQWLLRDCRNPFRIHRKEIMQRAKISCRSTYYRLMQDLNEFGYLDYRPTCSKHQLNLVGMKFGSKG